MNLKFDGIDFTKKWIDEREFFVKHALRSLEETREEQIKARKKKKIGTSIIIVIIIVAIIVNSLGIYYSKSWIIIVDFILVIVSSASVYKYMCAYIVLDKNSLESNFTELSAMLEEMLTCTEIEKAYHIIEKLSDSISSWYNRSIWKTSEISKLEEFLSSLWIGYSVFCNTALKCLISDEKYKQGIILTYADTDGDVYEEFYKCEFRENINIDADMLTWEDGQLVYIKKYKK